MQGWDKKEATRHAIRATAAPRRAALRRHPSARFPIRTALNAGSSEALAGGRAVAAVPFVKAAAVGCRFQTLVPSVTVGEARRRAPSPCRALFHAKTVIARAPENRWNGAPCAAVRFPCLRFTKTRRKTTRRTPSQQSSLTSRKISIGGCCSGSSARSPIRTRDCFIFRDILCAVLAVSLAQQHNCAERTVLQRRDDKIDRLPIPPQGPIRRADPPCSSACMLAPCSR